MTHSTYLAHQLLSCPDFDIVCAIGDPIGGGFLLGSDDGRIRRFDPTGLEPLAESRVAESVDVVNGIACSRNHIAISTPRKVVFGYYSDLGKSPSLNVAAYSGGAHGVIATPSGHFVAPRGHYGLLNARESLEPGVFQFDSNRTSTNALDFYKVAYLGTDDGYDVLSCALRQDGIGLVRLAHDSRRTSGLRVLNPGFDVVDVCALKSASTYMTTVALTRESRIILIQEKGDKYEFAVSANSGLRGTPYRIVIAHGEIFVLTSTALFTFPGMAKQLLAGNVNKQQFYMELYLDAFDVSVAFEKDLLVAETNGVSRIDPLLWLDNKADGNAKTETVVNYHTQAAGGQIDFLPIGPVLTAVSALD